VITFLPYQVNINTNGLLSISLRQAEANPDSTTIQPSSKDAYLYAFLPANNYGSTTYLEVWAYYDGTRATRSVLEFGLSGLEGANVSSATLSLYYYSYAGTNPVGRTYWAYKLSRTNWVQSEVTWNSYKSGSSWATAGGDYVTSSPSGGSITMPSAYGWVNWNVTEIVQNACDASISAEFLIKDATESVEDTYLSYFYSNNYATNTSHCPKLTIEYTPDAPDNPGGPSNLTDSSHNGTSIDLSWTKGSNSDYTLIRYGTDQYPTGTSDGTLAYNSTSNTTSVGSLSYGQLYYFRAWAYNSTTTLYSLVTSDRSCYTDPNAPTAFSVTSRSSGSIGLTWTKGTGADKTRIQYRTDQYPTTYSDGTQMYFGTATTRTLANLTAGQIYYFRAWSYDTESGYYDSYAQLTDYTLPASSSSFNAANPSTQTIDTSWVKGTGGDKTMVRRKEGAYPSSTSDGSQVYFDTGTSQQATGLTSSTTYYFRSWAYDSDSGYYSVPVTAVGTTIYESFNVPDDNYDHDLFTEGVSQWLAQSFTPTTSHNIPSAYLKLCRTGSVSPGNVTVSIRAIDSDGKPTGSDLCSGKIDGSTLTNNCTPGLNTTEGEWKQFTFNPSYYLYGNVTYAIVARADFGDGSNFVFWRLRTSAGYSGGEPFYSTDGEASWTAWGMYDFLFEEYGTITGTTGDDYETTALASPEITNTPSSWPIGVVATSAVVYFSATGAQDDDYALTTNTGNCAVDIQIQGQNIEGGSYDWVLSSSAGSEQYSLYANSEATPTVYDIEVKSSSYNNLCTDLAEDDTYNWSMKFTAPSSFNANDDGNQKTCTVTLVASES
jgi:hypothetical protein